MKLPVFFHIPKNAGTYVYNASYWTISNNLLNSEKPWSLEVFKNNQIAYRIICEPKNLDVQSKYTKVDAGYWWRVDINDLDLNDFDLYFLEVCDISFSSYREDVYQNLKSEIKPYEFLVIRDPYERIKSLYSYINSHQSSHEEKHKSFGDKSFVEYLNSDQLEGSWLIRSLLDIKNEIPIEEYHYDEVCEILDNMSVININDLDFYLNNFYLNCYGIESSTVKREVFANKTKNKISTAFEDLDEQTKAKFLEQTKWDKLIFEKYANKKILDRNQKKPLIVNCFYEGSDSGFGDFLRGSVHLFNHCSSKKIDFDINIQKHRISDYFEPIKSSTSSFLIDDLALKSKFRGKQFIHTLKRNTEHQLSEIKQQETKFIYSNYHPCLSDTNQIIKYLNLMPPISSRCCDFFKEKLKFTKNINDAVALKLKEEGLKAGDFNIIHFRLGDKNSFSNHDENLEDLYKDCLVKCLYKLCESDKPIVVLSDSNELKRFILQRSNRFPIHVLHLKSNHMQKKPSSFSGEIKVNNDDIFHAVFDMKLISLAYSIQSNSIYTHGSGFIYWIAKIFRIPVELKLLK